MAREPAEQRNAALIARLAQLARRLDLTKHGRPDYRALAKRAGLSESGLEGIVRRNSVPDALTLVRVARAARVSPLVLFEAAGWVTQEDVVSYMAQQEADLVPRAIEIERISPAELAAARRVIEGILAQLALAVDEQIAPPGGPPLPPPPIHTPGPEQSR